MTMQVKAAVIAVTTLLLFSSAWPASASLRKKRTGSYGVPPDTKDMFLIRLKPEAALSTFSVESLNNVVKTCPAGCVAAKSGGLDSEVNVFSDDDVQVIDESREQREESITAFFVSLSLNATSQSIHLSIYL